MWCENCNKLIPENLSYCPTCKMNEVKNTPPPIELKRTGSLMVPKEEPVDDEHLLEVPNRFAKEPIPEINKSPLKFLLIFLLIISFGGFLVVHNNLFNGENDLIYPELPPNENNNNRPDNNENNQPDDRPGDGIPAGHSIYRHHLSEPISLTWVQMMERHTASLYFISDEIHGYLIRGAEISEWRDAEGTTISGGDGILAIIDIVLPNEYILLIDMMEHINQAVSLAAIIEGEEVNLNLAGEPSSSEEIKAFIRERAR